MKAPKEPLFASDKVRTRYRTGSLSEQEHTPKEGVCRDIFERCHPFAQSVSKGRRAVRSWFDRDLAQPLHHERFLR